MSPSEFDLRAALREGEGDDLDVDRIIATGRARRSRRRNQLFSTAAAVVFVAAAATGGAFLINNGKGSDDTSGSVDRVAGAAPRRYGANTLGPPTAVVAGGNAAASGQAASAAGVACPSSFPQSLLPGGGSPGQFGAGGRLFAQQPDEIVVCAFRATAFSQRLVLTGPDATALAASLENASKTRSALPCPYVRSADDEQLALVGVTATGTRLPTVTTMLTTAQCNVQVTNGTAVRFNWQPTATLRQQLLALNPVARASGSPASS